MTWWVASLFSNVVIITIEYLHRQVPAGTTWLQLITAQPHMVMLYLGAQALLFYAFSGAPHWMVAWLVFVMGNSTMRVAAVYATGQPIGSWPLVLAGVAGVLASSYVLKQGLH